MILIKPHHLMDIIKLYGAGIEHFVPDQAFEHDFYRVANTIIGDLDTPLQFTIYGDDICKPCNRYKNSECTDSLDTVNSYHSKEEYNQTLDTRLITQLKIDVHAIYTVREFIALLKEQKDIVFTVWLEQDQALTTKRNELFQKGIKLLLSRT